MNRYAKVLAMSVPNLLRVLRNSDVEDMIDLADAIEEAHDEVGTPVGSVDLDIDGPDEEEV